MGFSLEGLFHDLNQAVDDTDKDGTEKLDELIAKIRWWQEYAIECGNLKE